MLGQVSLRFVPLETDRLRLEPVTAKAARAIVAGDLSGLTAADGWPHQDTADGLAVALRGGHPPGWLITLGGRVIGECGTHGPVDAAGCAEIGYGLAAPYRGQGYGSEAVAAMTEWLVGLPEVGRVCARTLIGNMPSRRVLEKAGFRLAGLGQQEAFYQRAAAAAELAGPSSASLPTRSEDRPGADRGGGRAHTRRRAAC
jgi:RimJ/RimL family protein N-acetyltransferase